MRSATNRVPVSARLLPYALALGCAALLCLPTSASAATILQFGQQSNLDFVSAAFSGNSATLTTHGVSNPASPTSIPITITQIGDVPNVNIQAFETFVAPGLTSSTAQVGNLKGGFSGEIIISTLPGGAGNNFLTTVFNGGTLNASSGAGGLNASEPTNTVSFTTANPNIIAALGGFTTATGNFSLSFTNLTPVQSGAFTDFTAQNTGLFAANVIPEPASIVMTGMGLMGVFGYGLLRRKSSKA